MKVNDFLKQTVYRSPAVLEAVLEQEKFHFVVTREESKQAKEGLNFFDSATPTIATVLVIVAAAATQCHIWTVAVTAWFFSVCFLIRIRKHLKTIDRWYDQERKKVSQIN